jgi:protein-S-isoprenylcysteine O-methyltransferase Ste14
MKWAVPGVQLQIFLTTHTVDMEKKVGLTFLYILIFPALVLLLGSIFGVLTGIALTILLMARILGEENMLARELEGYREYQQNVRYRLIPYIW